MALTYLVEAKEAQVPHNSQGTDPWASSDLSSHLQTDLNNLQRIGENHLGASSLQREKNKIKQTADLWLKNARIRVSKWIFSGL